MKTFYCGSDENGSYIIDSSGDRVPLGTPFWVSPEKARRMCFLDTIQTNTTGSSKLYWQDQKDDREGRR